MFPTGRSRCAEYCPIAAWCAETEAAVPDVLESHDTEIEKVTIGLQELDLREAAAEIVSPTDEQLAARAIWRNLGDRYLERLITSRKLAADALLLADVSSHYVGGGCEQGAVLRRVPLFIGATLIGARCRAQVPDPERSRIEAQMQHRREYDRAIRKAVRRGQPNPSPLDFGLYLWFYRPEEDVDE